eukprot:maker-scaffold436_size171858-snap-gene-0.33 protein:Tk10498 transcript:maker-scaffold436_size171858-snap-gene-0.33-mRNA-1 annotation:"clusterin-associated protein 1 isoform x1"
MAFRDLRSLTEMMRALGYPRLISLENFRQPNFQLVAEMLSWLVKRFEPTSDLPNEIDTEQDRVIFVRSVVQFMATKAHIKLHAKKLYQADGHSVKEVIKVAEVLYEAMKLNDSSELPTFDIGSKVMELKQTRQLGSQITTKGATLYDLLGREVELRERRSNVLARQLEITDVEMALKASLKAVDEDIKKTSANIENVSSNEASLDSKIEKKTVELDRNQKRLLTLKKVRPAFMDEYEKLEADLKKLYDDYILRFRCMAYLEQQVDELERVELERKEERELSTRRILERMREEEGGMGPSGGMESDLSSDQDSDEDEDEDEDDLSIANDKPVLKSKKLNGRPNNGPGSQRRVMGTMLGEDDDSGSLDSDSDLILDGDHAESNSEDDEDDELEVNEMAATSLKARKSARAPQPPTQPTSLTNESDEDF